MQRAYQEAGSRDSSARHWLWVAQVGAEQGEVYRANKGDIDTAVMALENHEPEKARAILNLIDTSARNVPQIAWLIHETEALSAAAQGDPQAARQHLKGLQSIFDQHPDLRELDKRLQQEHEQQQRQLVALEREQRLWAKAQEVFEQMQHAAQQGNYQDVMRRHEQTIRVLRELLDGGCSPDIEQQARTMHTRIGQYRMLALLRSSPDLNERMKQIESGPHFWQDAPAELRNQHTAALTQIHLLEEAAVELQYHRLNDSPESRNTALHAIHTLQEAGIQYIQHSTGSMFLSDIKQDILDRRGTPVSKRIENVRRRLDATDALSVLNDQLWNSYTEALKELRDIAQYQLQGPARTAFTETYERAIASHELVKLIDIFEKEYRSSKLKLKNYRMFVHYLSSAYPSYRWLKHKDEQLLAAWEQQQAASPANSKASVPTPAPTGARTSVPPVPLSPAPQQQEPAETQPAAQDRASAQLSLDTYIKYLTEVREKLEKSTARRKRDDIELALNYALDAIKSWFELLKDISIDNLPEEIHKYEKIFNHTLYIYSLYGENEQTEFSQQKGVITRIYYVNKGLIEITQNRSQKSMKKVADALVNLGHDKRLHTLRQSIDAALQEQHEQKQQAAGGAND
jgi:hypothetical protein